MKTVWMRNAITPQAIVVESFSNRPSGTVDAMQGQR
jgi:hypothetical protein